MYGSSNSLWKDAPSTGMGGLGGNLSEVSSQVDFNASPPLPASSADSGSVMSILKSQQQQVLKRYLV